MQTIHTYGTFEEASADADAEARAVASALRTLIAAVYPAAVEVPWPKLHVVGYGVGPKKATEHFCYIGIYGSHINLGFNHGASLVDPHSLLEGTGKAFRHVKVQNVEETARPELRELLTAAVREREQAQGADVSIKTGE